MERPISIRSIPAVGSLQVCIGSHANPYEADVERLEEFEGNHRRYVCSGWASVGPYPQPVVAVADYKAMGFLYMQKELPYSAQSAFLVSELVVHGGVNPDSSERIAQALLDGAITSMDAGAIVRAYAPLSSPVFKYFHFGTSGRPLVDTHMASFPCKNAVCQAVHEHIIRAGAALGIVVPSTVRRVVYNRT